MLLILDATFVAGICACWLRMGVVRWWVLGFVAILILILSRRWSLGAVVVYLSMDCRWFDLMRFVVLIGCGGSAMV